MLGKNVSASRRTGSIEEGNNIFIATKCEIVFTPIFNYNDKMQVLETNIGFHSNSMVNCLVTIL